MKRKGIVITEELLKEKLTPEQYEHYIHVRDTEGIDEAMKTLPDLESSNNKWITPCNSNIKKLRVENGLTQNDLANYLNITQKEYWRYEQDGYSVNILMLAQIAIFYNVSLDWISGWHPTKKPFFHDELLKEIYGEELIPCEAVKSHKKKK